jgi:hypothetical protein
VPPALVRDSPAGVASLVCKTLPSPNTHPHFPGPRIGPSPADDTRGQGPHKSAPPDRAAQTTGWRVRLRHHRAAARLGGGAWAVCTVASGSSDTENGSPSARTSETAELSPSKLADCRADSVLSKRLPPVQDFSVLLHQPRGLDDIKQDNGMRSTIRQKRQEVACGALWSKQASEMVTSGAHCRESLQLATDGHADHSEVLDTLPVAQR